jgi:hypothetical protein
MKVILAAASVLAIGSCFSCGPGLEREQLEPQRSGCMSSAWLAQSDAERAKTLAELIEACNQHVSALNLTTTDTGKEQ